MHDVHPYAALGVAALRTRGVLSSLQFRRVSDWLPGRMKSSLSDPQTEFPGDHRHPDQAGV